MTQVMCHDTLYLYSVCCKYAVLRIPHKIVSSNDWDETTNYPAAMYSILHTASCIALPYAPSLKRRDSVPPNPRA